MWSRLSLASAVAVRDTVAILYPLAEKALMTPAPTFLPAPKTRAIGIDVDIVKCFTTSSLKESRERTTLDSMRNATIYVNDDASVLELLLLYSSRK